jgi:hypothetical protein
MDKNNLTKIVFCYTGWKLITNTKPIQMIKSGIELLKILSDLPETKGYPPDFSCFCPGKSPGEFTRAVWQYSEFEKSHPVNLPSIWILFRALVVSSKGFTG